MVLNDIFHSGRNDLLDEAVLLTSLGWMFLFSDVLMSSDDVLINKINNEVGRVQNGLFLVYTKGMRKMVLLGGHILVHTLGKY